MEMVKSWKFVLVSILCIAYGSEPPKVFLPPLGYIEGTTMPCYHTDERFDAFLGVPFAEPPVGDLRFANPLPVVPWNNVYLANTTKPDCVQKDYIENPPVLKGAEDCLYLNVYRPSRIKNMDEKPLPVMVFIYGGAFFAGSANPFMHGPEYFMETKEVILVAMAYRLGAFGFLSTGDSNMPGNFGLKDQNMALKWVRSYISYFGGCPDNVTLFGHSAGATAVHLHILSDQSAGLFQRAIVMSGSANGQMLAPLTNPLIQARQQAEFCNISNANTLNTKMLTKALRGLDAEQILNSADRFKYWEIDPVTNFRPVIESPTPSSFLTKHPWEIMSSGNFNPVPWMIGIVPNEGAFRSIAIIHNEGSRKSFNADFDNLLQLLLELPPMDDDDLREVMISVVDFYFGGNHEINKENSQGLTDMLSDRMIFHPIYIGIKTHIKVADLEKNPLYLYKFNYRGSYSYSMVFIGDTTDFGVVHGDELIYLFRQDQLFKAMRMNPTEAKVIKEMVGTFVSFAKTGKPNGMKACTQEVLAAVGEDEFCNYKEIINTNDGFAVRTNNKFNMTAIRFWDNILNKPRRRAQWPNILHFTLLLSLYICIVYLRVY